MRYEDVKAGQWVQPKRRGYRMACCDCGLVHVFDFRVHARRIQFRAFRNERATRCQRRRLAKEGVE
jgi:hypothetical protein